MRLVLLMLALAGCRSNRDSLPMVQPSADSPATRLVTISKRSHYSPPCLAIDLGETVEWYNPTGNPINVTSGVVRGMPPLLYSPSLVAQSQRWRHRFDQPGRIDYFDANGAGGGAIDPYYGTRTGGAGTGAALGTICVRDANGKGCDQLCCRKAGPVDQCAPGAACDIPDDPEISFGFCGATSTPLDASTTDQ